MRGKGRGLDWLFWVGVVYLGLLAVFAVIGPVIRHPHDETALRQLWSVGIRGEAAPLGYKVVYAEQDMPAARAGIQVDDVINEIDGQRAAGLSSKEAESLLAGLNGSEVSVLVFRDGTAPMTVSLERTMQVKADPFMLPSSEFWLGTDELGRDVFARLAYGARMSLIIAIVVQTIALIAGIVMGTLGVFSPKWIQIPVLRLTDAMFAFPDILLAILIVGIWNARFGALIIALSITAWPAVARLARTQIASIKDRDYVIATQALGAPTSYLVRKHILPHLIGILLAVAMIDLAAVILAESALSFLGIGIQAPTPSWGGMIQAGRSNMNSYPIMLLWPCLILSVTVFALNFVGDGLRSLADPKSR